MSGRDEADAMGAMDPLAVCEASGRCAWCVAEAGVPWPQGVSSAICARHLAMERARMRQRRAPLTVIRHYQPDEERQVRALEAVLRDAPPEPADSAVPAPDDVPGEPPANEEMGGTSHSLVLASGAKWARAGLEGIDGRGAR
jgi:hypothetical protein